jgi:hypothetical protein
MTFRVDVAIKTKQLFLRPGIQSSELFKMMTQTRATIDWLKSALHQHLVTR